MSTGVWVCAGEGCADTGDGVCSPEHPLPGQARLCRQNQVIQQPSTTCIPIYYIINQEVIFCLKRLFNGDLRLIFLI